MDSKGQFKENLNNATNDSDSRSLLNKGEESHSTPFEHSTPAVIDTSHLKRDALEKRHMVAYAVGHFSNDLCAAQWFFYLVYYLKFIVGLTGDEAGKAMMSGQFADGIMTPVVGALSDRYKTRIGSRTPWYIFGTLVVLPSFFFLFLGPFPQVFPHLGETIPTGEYIYYLILPAVFNIGWAAVQIANMSIVNSLTYST